MRWLFVGVVLLAAGVGLAGMAVYERAGPLAADTPLVVSRGGLGRTAAMLQQQGALPHGAAARALFLLAARLTGGDGPIRAGEFAFPAKSSMRDVLLVLRHAPPVQHRLTIPEGLTAAQIATLLAESPALSGPAPVPQEGSVLPQTYAYVRNTERRALARRMQQAMRAKLAAIWNARDPGAGLSSPEAMLDLASIVERETAIPAERPLVARVFLNRLQLGMRLQSDPTVSYAASGGLGSLSRPLSRADLAQPGPFNTYAVAGLPPTPICAPGAASLEATAHPAVSNALYFVADGSGGHVFASDLESHQRNVARLRARLSRSGQSR